MKIRYIFFAIIAFFTLLPVLSGKNIVPNLISFASMSYALYFINKVEKGKKSDTPLLGGDKIAVLVTLVLNPIIAQAFYYFCWKEKFPKKARQANKWGFIVFGIEVVLYIGFVLLLVQNHQS